MESTFNINITAASKMKNLHFYGLLCLLLLLSTAVRAQAPSAKPLHVIEYNIWNGFEKDAARRARFVDWMKRQQPDIAGLTELVGFKRADLAALAKEYGHPYSAIVKEEGYPVGVTSRCPIEVVSKQVAGFWHGMLHVRTCGLDVIVTHLSPFEWKYRLGEAEKIVSYIEENGLDSCLVMGDFNAYSPFDAAEVESHIKLKENMSKWDASQKTYRNMRGQHFDYSVLSRFLSTGMADPCRMYVKPAAARMTFPTAFLYEWDWDDARLPALRERLDYILISPALVPGCVGAEVYNGRETEGISDHYPVGIYLTK